MQRTTCGKTGAETLYYKEIDRRILHDKTINLKIIFYETTITFSIADVINVGWVYEGGWTDDSSSEE